MRDWQVRRTLQPHPAGQRHWDRAYQQLLAWTEPTSVGAGLAGPEPPAHEVTRALKPVPSQSPRTPANDEGPGTRAKWRG